MLKAVDVANFFIDLANADPDDCMTNLRVNKLVYYAQAWSLVRFGRPLFSEGIEAWKHGPVIPSVYHAFQRYGRDRIKRVAGTYSADEFSSEELELLLDIVSNYGQYASWKLVDLTHEQGSPWSQVYTEENPHILIPESLLQDYYSRQKLTPFAISYQPDEVIGYRDAGNHLVLPKEYDE